MKGNLEQLWKKCVTARLQIVAKLLLGKNYLKGPSIRLPFAMGMIMNQLRLRHNYVDHQNEML